MYLAYRWINLDISAAGKNAEGNFLKHPKICKNALVILKWNHIIFDGKTWENRLPVFYKGFQCIDLPSGE
jgi:hypothetical protein